MVSRRGNSHTPHCHQALSVVSSQRPLYLELCIDIAPAKASQPILGWWNWRSLTVFRVKDKPQPQNKTPPPQKALSSTHSTTPQLPMPERALPPSEILRRLLHIPVESRREGQKGAFQVSFIQASFNIRCTWEQRSSKEGVKQQLRGSMLSTLT